MKHQEVKTKHEAEYREIKLQPEDINQELVNGFDAVIYQYIDVLKRHNLIDNYIKEYANKMINLSDQDKLQHHQAMNELLEPFADKIPQHLEKVSDEITLRTPFFIKLGTYRKSKGIAY